MSLAQPYQRLGGHFHGDCRPSLGRNHSMYMGAIAGVTDYNCDNRPYNTIFKAMNYDSSHAFSGYFRLERPNYNCAWSDIGPSSKRRKISDFSCKITEQLYQQQNRYENNAVNHTNQCQLASKYPPAYSSAPLVCDNSLSVVIATQHDDSSTYALATSKHDRSKLEDEEIVFMSKGDIGRCSPSRKDGIDALHEAHLRYSYCDFLQNLGGRLDLPQTTIGTAMVLCHRFFVRRSHASHDRFLIATSALFLASKSEETARSLNDVLRASCEILHQQDFTLLSHVLPIDWVEQYRERITEAEQLLLTTLNFELTVQHPFEFLATTLQKLGLSQSMLVNLSLSLIGEGTQ